MGELSQIIKLDATDSTNLFLKEMLLSKSVEDFTVIVAKKQLRGRGQMGTKWISEEGKNLTFSILKKSNTFSVANQFNLTICVSLAICDVLAHYNVPELKVKWPNDIMSGSSKICGILIENSLKGSLIEHSIIGIGLNVNQIDFANLVKVDSMKTLTGTNFDLDELLAHILDSLRYRFSVIEGKEVAELLPAYEELLFRKDKPSTFKRIDDQFFMGFVRSVSPMGKLVLELEDGNFEEFSTKEVTLLY